MMKNGVYHMSRMTRQSPYIGGYNIYDDTDTCTTPPLLAFFNRLYIQTYTHIHYILTPPIYGERRDRQDRRVTYTNRFKTGL